MSEQKNKNVIISVKGTQSLQNGEDINEIELITEGKYYKKGDSYYISYKESEVTGMAGTTTTVKVVDKVITLMRFGAVNSQFVFEKGKRHLSYYETQYGVFTIAVLASEVNIQLNDSGGEISVDYELDIDNNKTGNNDFYMLIRKAGHSDDKHDREGQTAD